MENAPSLKGALFAHDPSRIAQDKAGYFFFSTGNNIMMHHSPDMVTWENVAPVLHDGPPAWAKAAVPRNHGSHIWAPDLIYNKHTGLWTLFYSFSSWGSRVSVIGALTTRELKAGADWTDAGVVTQTDDHSDHNSIDPCPLFDAHGDLWMSFGSFWTGIKLTRLDIHSLKPTGDTIPICGGAATDMEASCLWREGDYYYLFVNRGQCCRGVQSTYYIILGRSKQITGPYLDKEGKSLLEGGGTRFKETAGTVIGPGQSGVATIHRKHYFSYHYYDGAAGGRPTLGIDLLVIDKDGWPELQPWTP